MQRGMAALPDLHVSDSSEAMLSGRKPPFRLLVRAAHRDGRKVNIRHAVSEGFVVSILSLCSVPAVVLKTPSQYEAVAWHLICNLPTLSLCVGVKAIGAQRVHVEKHKLAKVTALSCLAWLKPYQTAAVCWCIAHAF